MTLWKVGQLARETGLTVRTLHHYDQIGLLKPGGYTASGHRLYDADNVVRLQQIVSLRQLGFGLDDIQSMLTGDNLSPLDVLNLHLAKLRQQLAEQQSLIQRLEDLQRSLDREQPVEPGQILHIIKEITMFENYYTPEQLAQLRQRREQLGEAAIRQAEDQWRTLIDRVRAEMEKGTDPSDPVLKPLVTEWQGLIQQFTGGDPGIGQSLANFNRDNPNHAQQHGMPLDGELFAYVAKASAAHKQ